MSALGTVLFLLTGVYFLAKAKAASPGGGDEPAETANAEAV